MIGVLLLGGAVDRAIMVRASSAPSAAPARARRSHPPGTNGRPVKRTSAQDFDPPRRRRRARTTRPQRPSTGTPAPPGPPRTTTAARWPTRRVSACTSTPPRASAPPRSRSTRRRPAGRREIQVAPTAAPKPPPARPSPTGGSRSAGGTVRRKQPSASQLRTGGKRYRYYLVWITKLPARPGARQDLRGRTLFREDAPPRTRAPGAIRRGTRRRPMPQLAERARSTAPAAVERTARCLRVPHLREAARRRHPRQRVLSSLHQPSRHLPLRPTKKSTRASPEQPTRRNDLARQRAGPRATTAPPDAAPGSPAPPRPARTSPRSRTNRPPAARPRAGSDATGSPLPVTEHSTSMPGRERLDDHQPVVLERGLQRPVELLARPTPSRSPPTTRAAPA